MQAQKKGSGGGPPQKPKPQQQQAGKKAAASQPPSKVSNKIQAENSLDKKYKTTALFKNIYDSPFRVSWPSVSKQDWDEIQQTLASSLKLVTIRGPSKSSRAGPGRKRKAEEITQGDEAPEPEAITGQTSKKPTTHPESDQSKEHQSGSVSSTPAPAVQKSPEEEQLLIGINEVTKQLERDQVQLVVVAKAMEPNQIVQHFPVLCSLRSVALCPLPTDPKTLGQFFGLSSVICFAFKKTDNPTKFDHLIKFITSKTSPIEIPWLHDGLKKLAAQNLQKFKQAIKAPAQAQNNDAMDVDMDSTTAAQNVQLEQNLLKPLRMRRAEFTKQVPVVEGKGKNQKKAKQPQAADGDAMQL